MSARKTKAEEPQTAPETTEPAAGDKKTELQQAEEKLARMNETDMLCRKYRTDFARLRAELTAMKFSEAEIKQLMKPKGRDNVPGFAWIEKETQRKYVEDLKTHTPRGDSHAGAVEHDRQQQQDDGLAR